MATNEEVMEDFVKNFPGMNLGEVQEVGGATIIPIIEDINFERDYITFAEAVKAKILKFTDTGNINQLKIKNKGDKDCLIYAGQVVSSQGTQDRVISETTFIGAKEEITVTCNCCQASKGIVGGTAFNASVVSPRSIKYCSIMTDVDHYARQSEIWNKVNKTRESLKKKGSYKAKPTDQLEAVVEETKKNTKELLKKAQLVDNQRGVIVLNNESKLVGLELFDSPDTYKSLHEKIVESYLEDITDEQKKIPPTQLKSALQNELKTVFAKKISVSEKTDRTLIRKEEEKLQGEVLFRKGKKKKNRVVLFRLGSEE